MPFSAQRSAQSSGGLKISGWDTVSLKVSGNNLASGIAYDPVAERIVVVGGDNNNSTAWWSDGDPVNPLSWNEVSVGGHTEFLGQLLFNNGLFLIGAYNENNGSAPRMFTSPDGITWTNRTTPTQDTSADNGGVVFGNGIHVAMGGTSGVGSGVGYIISSVNGTTGWTERLQSPAGLGFPGQVVFANGQFVAVGQDKQVNTSPDGINWTLRTLPTPTGTFKHCRSVAYLPLVDKWVISGFTGADKLFWSSTDNAVTWAESAAPWEDGNSTIWWALPDGRVITDSKQGFGISETSFRYTRDGTTWDTTTIPQATNIRNTGQILYIPKFNKLFVPAMQASPFGALLLVSKG